MTDPKIRPAVAEEYDEIARVWMESWVSTGLGEASNFLLANLRARLRREIENGWSLFVADADHRARQSYAMVRERFPDLALVPLFNEHLPRAESYR